MKYLNQIGGQYTNNRRGGPGGQSRRYNCTNNCSCGSTCYGDCGAVPNCDTCCELGPGDHGPYLITSGGNKGPQPTQNFTGTHWQQDTPVGTRWQRSGVFNNFNGDEPAPKKGSVAQYVMGLLGVGLLFYTIGFALKKGQIDGK